MSEVRITDPKTGGQKGQKPERFDLFPFDALEEVARVYGIGATKYADDNWLKGYSWRLSAGALMRHVARFMLGEDRDPESGCLHLAHAAWHCLTLITFKLRGLGTDDRAVPKAVPPAQWEPAVGYRVKVRGEIGTVFAVDERNDDYGVETDGMTYWYKRSELEAVTSPAGVSGAV